MPVSMRKYLDLPPVPVRTSGLLAGLTIIDVSGQELFGVEAESDACFVGHRWDEYCTLTPAGPKTFDDGALVLLEGDPFTLYGSAECDLISLERAEQRARNRLAYSEPTMIGFELLAVLDAMTTDPAGAGISLALAIANAEATAEANFGGDVTLIMPTPLASLAASRGYLYPRDDGTLRTKLGSLVLPAAVSTVAAYDKVIYATGRIILLRGPVESYSTTPMADGATITGYRALAERTYVPLIDCFVVAFGVDIAACDCTVAPAADPQQGGTGGPPQLDYLSQTTVSVGNAPFGLHAHGEDFTDDDFITLDGDQRPTAFVDDHELITVVDPGNYSAGQTISVTITGPHGTSAATLQLSFTA